MRPAWIYKKLATLGSTSNRSRNNWWPFLSHSYFSPYSYVVCFPSHSDRKKKSFHFFVCCWPVWLVITYGSTATSYISMSTTDVSILDVRAYNNASGGPSRAGHSFMPLSLSLSLVGNIRKGGGGLTAVAAGLANRVFFCIYWLMRANKR